MFYRSTPETREQRIAHIAQLVHNALRDARVAASSGLPTHETTATNSAKELTDELQRRETLLQLEEMSNSGLRHTRDRLQKLSKSRLVKIKALRHVLRNTITNSKP